MPGDERLMATIESVKVGEEFGPIEYDLTEDSFPHYVDLEVVSTKRLELPNGRRAAPNSTMFLDHHNKVFASKYSTLGTIHARARHRYVRPLVPPVHVVVTGKIVETYIRRGREYYVIETVMRDGEGNDLVISENTWMMNASVRHEDSAAPKE